MDAQTFSKDYLRRLIDGDEATERHFTGYFSDLLRIKLRSRLRSSQLVDDVRQETFLRVLRGIHAIEEPEKLGAYVNSVCNNVLLESFRSQTRYQGVAYELPEQVDESWQPAEALINEERKKVIRKVLAEMPEKEQRLLRRLFLEDCDKDDLCREFQVDREYLRVMLHRAKNRFRTILIKKTTAGK